MTDAGATTAIQQRSVCLLALVAQRAALVVLRVPPFHLTGHQESVITCNNQLLSCQYPPNCLHDWLVHQYKVLSAHSQDPANKQAAIQLPYETCWAPLIHVLGSQTSP